MNNTGQITVIIIVVILLLAIFGAVTYMTTSVQQQRGEEAVRKQILSQAKMQPIQEYVTSCLDLSAKAALEFMGRQGGYLYLSQGGPIADQSRVDFGNTYITYEEYDLAYAITKPRGTIAGFLFSETPEYPWKTFPEVSINAQTIDRFEGFFGFNYLLELLKPFTNSVQEQLEVYVKNNVLACVDWPVFEIQNLEIQTEDPVINVTFGKDAVFFAMIYPITITDLGTEASAELHDFSISYDIRLKDIFDFLEWITDNDVADIQFKLKDAAIANIRTDVIKDVEGGYDDVVVIRDAQSTILGQPFEFRFAVQNRPPALGLINNSQVADDVNNFVLCGVLSEGDFTGPTITLTNDDLLMSNPLGCDPRSLSIKLKGYDPDDDELDFSLWIIGTKHTSYTLGIGEVGGPGIDFPLTIKVSDDQYEDFQRLVFATALGDS